MEENINENNEVGRSAEKFHKLFRKRLASYKAINKIQIENYPFEWNTNAIKCIPCNKLIFDQEKRSILLHDGCSKHKKILSGRSSENNTVINSNISSTEDANYTIEQPIPNVISDEHILVLATAALDIINLHPSDQNTQQLQSLNPLLSLLCTKLRSQTGKLYEPLFAKESIHYDFQEWKKLMLPKKAQFCQINDATDRIMESWANAIHHHYDSLRYLIKLFTFVMSIQVSVCENERAHSIRRYNIFNVYRNKLSHANVDKLLRLFINSPNS